MGFLDRVRAALAPSAVTLRASFAPTSPYVSGSTGRRTRGWYAPATGPTSVIASSGERLRNRCRDLARNNPYARSAIDAFVANAIGTGIWPRPAVEGNAAFNTAARLLFERSASEIEASGTTDFAGAQSLGCREIVEAGEVFFRKRPRRAADDLAVPLQLQVLEAEHVPFWKNEENPATGNQICAGIEINGVGRKVAYWMYREHPGEFTTTGLTSDLVRVPADQIIHVFRPLRAGQVRGEPWLAIAALRLYDLDEYVDAEVVRKKAAAMFVGTIEGQPGAEVGGGIAGTDTTEAADGTIEVPIEPLTITEMPEGKTLKFNAPADVGPNYAAFQQDQLRAIAAGIGLTYEMLTGDLSQVNYSSIRAGVLEFRRRCEAFQYSVFIHQFCRDLYAAWLEAAVLSGALSAPGYARDPAKYRGVTWHTQGWKWVDPAKEISAALDAIAGGLTSRERVIAEQGEDIERIDEENTRAMQRESAKGLAYTTNVSQATRDAALEPATPAAPKRTGTNG